MFEVNWSKWISQVTRSPNVLHKAFGRKDVYQQECLRISLSGHGKRLENTSSTSEEKELGLVQSFPLAAQLLGRCFSFPCNHLFCAKFSRCFKREIIRYHFAMEHEEPHPNTHFSENVFLGRTWIIFDPIHAHFSYQLTTRPRLERWACFPSHVPAVSSTVACIQHHNSRWKWWKFCRICSIFRVSVARSSQLLLFLGGFSSRAGTWQLCRWDGRSSPLASLPEVDGRNQAPAPFHQHRWAK